MTDRVTEEMSIEKLAQDNYEGFVKAFLRLEMGLSNMQLDRLYQEYMNEDDMSLINPHFWRLEESIDWQVVYMTNHLEHLLTYTSDERDGIMFDLQQHFQHPEVTTHIWLNDGKCFTDRGLKQVNAIIDPDLPFYQEVNAAYSKLFNDEILADERATFLKVVNAAVRVELLEDKEAFLRHYLNITEWEKSTNNQEKQEVERASMSSSLTI